MNDDDFFGEDDTNSNKFEILLEQRATERLKNEMRTTGFRDGHQKQMENETCLQFGFDVAYKLFARIGFLLGELRSLVIYLDATKTDSMFMAQVLNKLDQIESYNDYESFLIWNEHSLNSDSLNVVLNDWEAKLVKLRDQFLSSSSLLDFKANVISNLNEFKFKLQTDDELNLNETLESLNVTHKLAI